MIRTTTAKALKLAIGIVVFSLCGTALAQTQKFVSTKIGTVPAGVVMEVSVDGQTYKTPVTLIWPAGSAHTLHSYDQIDVTGNTKWVTSGFTTSRGTCADPCVATADQDIAEINVNVGVTYKVQVVFGACGSDSPGTVTVGGAKFTCTGSAYAPSGSLTLQASPNPGWVFTGWYTGLGNDSQAFLNTATVSGPLSIYPKFSRARTITINTNPTGLQVLADRSPVSTPATLSWGGGTTHSLGSVNDQIDNHGKLWVFDSWNDGEAINHSYFVTDVLGGLSVTANYVAGQRVSFLTSPPGLSLTVDGRTNWLSYNFAWALNSQHSVSAPLTQTDEAGNTYVFKSWSQGGGASQIVVATGQQDSSGYPLDLRYTAVYEGQSRITVNSQVSGVAIQVDGQDCALPCVIEKPNGSRIRLTAPASLKLSDDSRLDFQGWGDSGEVDRTLTAVPGPQSFSLNYKLRNRLNATITPPEGARLVLDPPTPDGFYDAQTQVQVSIETKLGFKFQNWDGDLTGASRTLTISMTAPKSVRAVLDRVPALLDNAVKNAAGETPLDAVAAGSIVSIFGVNLAADYQSGPSSPLRQTLGGLTVTVSGKLLPLVFVSPDQINAQLPSDLLDGDYTLTVHADGKPDVSAGFKVARNAPGLFNKLVDGQAFGLFLHENGDPITADSRAKRGETVTLLGNGLGPFLQMPPEGFAVQEAPSYALSDAVTILSGDTVLDPLYAGIASGRVGMTAIRFKIDDRLDAGTNASIKVRVRDLESNTVLLPVE